MPVSLSDELTRRARERGETMTKVLSDRGVEPTRFRKAMSRERYDTEDLEKLLHLFEGDAQSVADLMGLYAFDLTRSSRASVPTTGRAGNGAMFFRRHLEQYSSTFLRSERAADMADFVSGAYNSLGPGDLVLLTFKDILPIEWELPVTSDVVRAFVSNLMEGVNFIYVTSAPVQFSRIDSKRYDPIADPADDTEKRLSDFVGSIKQQVVTSAGQDQKGLGNTPGRILMMRASDCPFVVPYQKWSFFYFARDPELFVTLNTDIPDHSRKTIIVPQIREVGREMQSYIRRKRSRLLHVGEGRSGCDDAPLIADVSPHHQDTASGRGASDAAVNLLCSWV